MNETALVIAAIPVAFAASAGLYAVIETHIKTYRALKKEVFRLDLENKRLKSRLAWYEVESGICREKIVQELADRDSKIKWKEQLLEQKWADIERRWQRDEKARIEDFQTTEYLVAGRNGEAARI